MKEEKRRKVWIAAILVVFLAAGIIVAAVHLAGKSGGKPPSPPEVSEPEIVSAPEPSGGTADGGAAELLTGGKVLNGVLEYVLDTKTYAPGEKRTPPETGWSTDVPKASEPGTYVVWYRVVSEKGEPCTEPKYVECAIAAPKFKITWKNWDGFVLKTEEIEQGKTPAYGDTNPVRPDTAEHTYSFKGWDPAVAAVTKAATYTATYTESARKYSVALSVQPEGAGTLSASEAADVPYGSTISASGNVLTVSTDTPVTVTATPASGFVFKGFEQNSTKINETGFTVKKDVSITAKFEQAKIIKNPESKTGLVAGAEDLELLSAGVAQNGELEYVLDTKTYAEGETRTAPVEGWSADIPKAKNPGTYTVWYRLKADSGEVCEPAYVECAIAAPKFKITWKNWDGSVLKTEEIEQGKTPAYGETNPARPDTADKTYSFKGWDPAVAIVSGPATYTATYTESARKYSVALSVAPTGAGTLSASAVADVPYGSTISASGNVLTVSTDTLVTVTATPASGYVFKGFEQNSTKISETGFTLEGNTSITAKFEEIKIGTEPQTKTYDGTNLTFEVQCVSGGIDDFTVRYSADDGTTWKDNAVNAGTYDVRVSREASGMCGSFEKIIDNGLVINKADPTVNVSEIRYLTETGEPVELVKASTDGGTLCFSTDGTNYDTGIPKKTEEGKYNVWYKVEGDDNHNGKAPAGPIECVIYTPGMTFEPNADGTGYNLTGCTADKESVLVQRTFKLEDGDEKPVTGIGKEAFKEKTQLKTIEIPSTVTFIGDDAFSGCESLRSFTVPDAVTEIGPGAFAGCAAMESVTFTGGGRLNTIDEFLFFGCASLASIKIPSGVTGIGSYAFYNCTSLREVSVPAGVTSIGENAFGDCSGLKSAVFEGTEETNKLTSVGKNAFKGCVRLIAADLPAGVSEIGESAFEKCESLISVRIPAGVKTINKRTFALCYNLVSAELNEGLKSIGEQAFASCEGITCITVPSSVTTIGKDAFNGCIALYSVTNLSELVPSDESRLTANAKVVIDRDGNKTFAAGCEDFEFLDVEDGAGGILRFVRGEDGYFLIACVGDGNVTLPEQVKDGDVLHDYAVRKIKGARKIVVPETVETLESEAFLCGSLESVELKGVKTIGDRVFANCYNLDSVVLPSSLTSLGQNVFDKASLTEITFEGTTTQWNEITKAAEWNAGSAIKKVNCTDATITL